MHELGDKSSAERGHLYRGLERLGEGGVEKTQTQTILQVPDGV